MTKFKIGDEVRIIKPHANSSNFLNTTFIITDRNTDWDGEPSWCGAGQPYRYKESQLELAHPLKSTGFEVGKKYVLTSTQHRVEVLHSHGGEHWLKNEKGKTFVVRDRDFIYYEEYIPPLPEEWRIVYKDQYGNITVGKTPFKSESEAKASRYWTDHSSSFKTIRVDA